MARSRINDPTQDLMSDSGAVLFSFVKGEQLEFPITLTFINDAASGYTYEAVIVEGENVVDQVQPPNSIKLLNPAKTILNVRVPDYEGVWSETSSYMLEDVVQYGIKYYKRLSNMTVPESLPPDQSAYWEETTRNKVYVQFVNTVAADWAQSPVVGIPVYGFFELRVTEPINVSFRRTWKPVRGLVEILFSPTDIVPDV